MKHPLPLACLALLAAGCAAQTSTRYPSLLPRPIESRSDAEPAVEPQVAAPDTALDRQLGGFKSTLAETASAFAPAADRAEQTARDAKGDPAGSERWITAQTALAELDGYRAQTSATLSDLEQLAIARGAAGQPEYPALESLRTMAETQLAAETRRIAAIQATLPEA